jgi:hypothetical protein
MAKQTAVESKTKKQKRAGKSLKIKSLMFAFVAAVPR